MTARPDKPSPSPALKALAVACARAADEKVAESIVILEVAGLTPIADYLVIATAESNPHMKAVADAMEEAVRAAGGSRHHREGDQDSPWLLIDFHDIIAHVFNGAARRFYDLERLWDDAPRVEWSDKPAPVPASRPGTASTAPRADRKRPARHAKPVRRPKNRALKRRKTR
jgi:ribosome-associated protein